MAGLSLNDLLSKPLRKWTRTTILAGGDVENNVVAAPTGVRIMACSLTPDPASLNPVALRVIDGAGGGVRIDIPASQTKTRALYFGPNGLKYAGLTQIEVTDQAINAVVAYMVED